MNIAELGEYLKDPHVNNNVSQRAVDTLANTMSEAVLVEFDYIDPALVLLPLSKISPSVPIRRQLQVALDFRGISLDHETEWLVERLKNWRLEGETVETLRRSHDATKEMLQGMFAACRARGMSHRGSLVSRSDLAIAVFRSGSPILENFGANFANYALTIFSAKSESSSFV